MDNVGGGGTLKRDGWLRSDVVIVFPVQTR